MQKTSKKIKDSLTNTVWCIGYRKRGFHKAKIDTSHYWSYNRSLVFKACRNLNKTRSKTHAWVYIPIRTKDKLPHNQLENAEHLRKYIS